MDAGASNAGELASPLALSRVEAFVVDSLVEQTVDGDDHAFTQLVQRFQPQVFRWALAYAADADEAEDVVQETFVLALRHARQYRGGGAFHIWLYQITRRAAGRMRRSRQRRVTRHSSHRAIPERTVYETDPGARVDRERMSIIIRGFWRELPERQRAVLDLVDLQGFSPAEAAAMLELNPSTLRTNLFKARQTLRTRILGMTHAADGAKQ